MNGHFIPQEEIDCILVLHKLGTHERRLAHILYLLTEEQWNGRRVSSAERFIISSYLAAFTSPIEGAPILIYVETGNPPTEDELTAFSERLRAYTEGLRK